MTNIRKRALRRTRRLHLPGIVAAGLVAASAACSILPSHDPTPTPVATVAGDDLVCDAVQARDVTDIIHMPITSEYHSFYRLGKVSASMHCGIRLDDPDFFLIYVDYEFQYYWNNVTGLERQATFEDIKEWSGAQPFTVDGLEGEGVTMFDVGRSFAVWHYPDDHMLIINLQPYMSTADEVPERADDVIALVALFSPAVVARTHNGVPPQQPTTPPAPAPTPTTRPTDQG